MNIRNESSTNILVDTKQNPIKASIKILSKWIHQVNLDNGWWHDLKSGTNLAHEALSGSRLGKAIIAEKIALCHSELSEALEGLRKNLMDDKLPHRPMIEVELADTIIRILDMSKALNLDVGGAIMEKMEFNATREDHKPENRIKENGKAL